MKQQSITDLIISYENSKRKIERIQAGDITAYSEKGKALIEKWSKEPRKDYTEQIKAMLETARF